MMKLAYEKPMMSAELYRTNSYCAAACETKQYFKDTVSVGNGTYVDESGKTYANNFYWPFLGSAPSSDYEYGDYNLDLQIHWFKGAAQSVDTEYGKSYYWNCTCCNGSEHSGGGYILEYSPHHTGLGWADEGTETEQVFYLYYDRDNDNVLDIADFPSRNDSTPNNTNGPWSSSGSDIAISRVSVTPESYFVASF